MAASITGTPTQITNTGNSSQSISAPSDAKGIFACVSGRFASANQFSGGTVTYNGVSLTCAADADGTGAVNNGAIFYLNAPATGSNTFAWTWGAAPTAGVIIIVGFVKDADNTAGALRDADAALSGVADFANTPSLTCVTDDLIVAWSSHEIAIGNTSESFTFSGGGSITKAPFTFTSGIAQGDVYNNTAGGFSLACGSLATALPTGNQAVNCGWSRTDGGTTCAVVIKPAAPLEKTGLGRVGP